MRSGERGEAGRKGEREKGNNPRTTASRSDNPRVNRDKKGGKIRTKSGQNPDKTRTKRGQKPDILVLFHMPVPHRRLSRKCCNRMVLRCPLVAFRQTVE